MIKYSVDEKNILVINNNNKSFKVNGSFNIDKDNSLIYLVNESNAWKKEQNLSGKIIFKGIWQLDNNHNLILVLNDSSKLKLTGEIIALESNKIVFELISCDKKNQSSIETICLTGFWNADKFNRIYFCVTKRNPDFLFLDAGWVLNNNQHIVYSYTKTELKRKTKESKKLTLSGFWQFNSQNQITYIISKAIGSFFEFKVQVESSSMYPKQGVVKYRIGVGVRESKRDRILCLYGTWKIQKDLSLSFEMEYEKGKIRTYKFATQINFNQSNKVEISLLNSDNEKLGIYLIYTYEFLKEKQGELFIRLKKMQNDSRIEGGFKVKY